LKHLFARAARRTSIVQLAQAARQRPRADPEEIARKLGMLLEKARKVIMIKIAKEPLSLETPK
jgi:hypothetical protein